MALRSVCFVCLIAICVFAQESVIQPPPIWPADGRIPEKWKNQYVFLSPNRDAVVLSVPEDWDNPNSPRRVMRVDLHNQLQPSVRTTMSSPEPGIFKYSYKLSNAPEAKNVIGTWALVVPLEWGVFRITHQGTPEHKKWSGSRARVVNAARVGLPGRPLGCYARWFYDDTSQLVTPGGSLGGFEILSNNRPGFTTAFLSSGESPYFDPNLSEIVFQQLDQLRLSQYPNWPDHYVVTIGPKFSPTTAALEVMKDFLAGIEQLIVDKRLNAQSPFVKEILNKLYEAIRSNSDRPLVISAKPSTEWEAEIKAAIEMSLLNKT